MTLTESAFGGFDGLAVAGLLAVGSIGKSQP